MIRFMIGYRVISYNVTWYLRVSPDMCNAQLLLDVFWKEGAQTAVATQTLWHYKHYRTLACLDEASVGPQWRKWWHSLYIQCCFQIGSERQLLSQLTLDYHEGYLVVCKTGLETPVEDKHFKWLLHANWQTQYVYYYCFMVKVKVMYLY